ncbi:MAG TPA: DUF2946 family protein [Burkholderiales bacterium]|nr:DUF2946 family protein [Burkholderiales bacterium]
MVLPRSTANWPDVPAVYGWLELDRRGDWRIKGERIGHAGLRDFIARNYQPDQRGRWYFQNGPQRVFVALAYTPLVVHHDGETLIDQCGRRVVASAAYLDEEGSVLIEGGPAIALLDDRDLARYAEIGEQLPRVRRAELERRFGFVREPRPS